MSTESAPPSGSSPGILQNPEPVAQSTELQQAAQEATKPNPPTSVFVNSEPLREDQIQNAVKFLSHPKVRGSPVIHRRSFLEKKGLTKEEIDEAFRRVPDPSPSSQPASFSQDVKPLSNVQTQASVQASQPTAVAPAGVVPPGGILTERRFHWYHGALGVGLLAASGCGTALLMKNVAVPRLKSWIRKVISEEDDDDDLSKKTNLKPSVAEEAAAAAKAAAVAAADVAKASQEMLDSRKEERRTFEELVRLLDSQVREMKSMSNVIRSLEGQTNGYGKSNSFDQELHSLSISGSKQPYSNGKTEVDVSSVKPSVPQSVESSAPPHPKSYMEIMAMIQRGEKPSNIRDINDMPPDPNQPLSGPRIAPRTKPWEVGQLQNGPAQVFPSQIQGEGLNFKVQENGLNNQSDEDIAVPWWQRKNVRITEMENEDDASIGPYGARSTEQPVRRTWVPPQPPPVAMPEAVEAIRRPKPPVQKEAAKQEVADEQLNIQPSDATDELQRITKISELGVAAEMNGVSGSQLSGIPGAVDGVSSAHSSEMQPDEI